MTLVQDIGMLIRVFVAASQQFGLTIHGLNIARLAVIATVRATKMQPPKG
jgi:hypothetical protein